MAQLGQHDELEDQNAGVPGPEPQEAQPGFMGKIYNAFSNVRQSVSSPRSTAAHSTPTTETGLESGTEPAHETKVDDLSETPGAAETRGAETRDVGMPPSRPAPAVPEDSRPVEQVHNEVLSKFDVSPETSPAAPTRAPPGVLEETGSRDQVHNDAVGLETAGAGGRVGDGVPSKNSRSVDTGSSATEGVPSVQEGAPANPAIPKKDLGEKIIDKLPFSHANPYSVGNTTPSSQAGNPYIADNQGSTPASTTAQSSSPGMLGKLKNLVTGQKATQGTATENATTGTSGTTAERDPLVHGYTQEPSPRSGDILHKGTEKYGRKGPDVGSAEAWPSPANPNNIPSATRTDEQGRPIEGPTQPTENVKRDGVMTKLMDKLHLHGPKSPKTPTAASGATTATSPATTGGPSTNAGLPTYSEDVPSVSNSEGMATGPSEA